MRPRSDEKNSHDSRCKNCGKVLGQSRLGAISSFLLKDLRCSCGYAESTDGKAIGKAGARPGAGVAKKAEKCQRCGKEIVDNRSGGSITQFVFKDSRCHCQTPLRAKQFRLDDRKFATLTKRWTKSTGAAEQRSDLAASQIFPPGTVIGGVYIVESLIGQGGMGSVYQVRHNTLGRFSALKVLDRSLIDVKNWKRFQLEAKSISNLNHPCFVHVYDLALHEGKQPYYVMDYLDGVTLDEVLRDGPMRPRQAIDLFLGVADGLAFAHRSGVIHRDLKPANIFIEEQEGGKRTIKILDFGIAKLVGMDSEDQSLTSLGDVFGSPYYMSPEQCLGETVDARSDIYSFGCSLFEAIAGKPPFDSEIPYAVVEAHISKNNPQLKDVASSKLPQALSAFIDKCLAKEPARRYQNMEKLISHLRLISSGEGARVEESLQEISENNETNHSSKASPLVVASFAVGGIVAIGLISWAILTLLQPQAAISLRPVSEAVPDVDIVHAQDTLAHILNSSKFSKTPAAPDEPTESKDGTLSEVINQMPSVDDKTSPPSNSRPPEVVYQGKIKCYKCHFGGPSVSSIITERKGETAKYHAASEQLIPADCDKVSLWTCPDDNSLPNVMKALPDNFLTSVRIETPFDTGLAKEFARQERIREWVFSCNVDAAQLDVVAQSKLITLLDFWSTCTVDYNGLLKLLSVRTTLKSFSCWAAIPENTEVLKALAKFKGLEELALSQSVISGADLSVISKLDKLKSLSLLSKTPFLTDSDFDKLSGLKDIESINLRPVLLTTESLPKFAAFKNLKHLELKLKDHSWHSQDIEELRRLLNIKGRSFVVSITDK